MDIKKEEKCNMMEVKISIILPSLNVVNYIRECLESVLNQTINDIEIICIDAGSNDGTVEIIQEYAIKDSRIRYVHSDYKSYGYQVNLGISIAKGKYVAVLETDDFVDQRMYESLCSIADKYDVDYVKADFDSFSVLSNGERYFSRVRIFEDSYEWYNHVISPRENERLFCTDYFLWKGIYRKDFLVYHDIKLNETPGAAFQDMAFMLQVLSYANRAYYLDESFYRYRIDREEASTYSPNILRYGYQEFKYALELIDAGKPIWEKGLYIHMIHSFRGELYSVMQKLNCEFENELIKPYYEWHINKIKSAIDKGIIELDVEINRIKGTGEYIKNMLDDINSVVNDVRKVISKSKQQKTFELELSNNSIENGIIIFGCGKRGRRYLKDLDGKCNIIGFCDNSTQYYGNTILGYKVYAPEDCFETFKGCYYIIANKYRYNDIFLQLVKMGIDENKVLINPLT